MHGFFRIPMYKPIIKTMNKAKFVKEITVIDPDTKGNVQLAIYKHEAGGMFGIDASFLEQYEDEVTIPDPFADKFRKLWLMDNEGELTKTEKIEAIRKIIEIWGGTTSSELELNGSPCLSSKGTNKNNISELIEGFYLNSVNVITYQNETEIADNSIPYSELSDDILDEVYNIILEYNTNQEKEFIGLNDNKD